MPNATRPNYALDEMFELVAEPAPPVVETPEDALSRRLRDSIERAREQISELRRQQDANRLYTGGTPAPAAGRVTMTGRVQPAPAVQNVRERDRGRVDWRTLATPEANRGFITIPADALYAPYDSPAVPHCDHKFIDTTFCIKCGAQI